GDGEVNPESRALPWLAVHLDTAAVLLHQAVHRGQPQARSLPGRLGRETRFEDARLRVLVHPAPGVADGEAHVLASPHGATNETLILGEVRAAGLDPQHA